MDHMSSARVCPPPQQSAVDQVLELPGEMYLLWRPRLHAVQPEGHTAAVYAVCLKCKETGFRPGGWQLCHWGCAVSTKRKFSESEAKDRYAVTEQVRL